MTSQQAELPPTFILTKWAVARDEILDATSFWLSGYEKTGVEANPDREALLEDEGWFRHRLELFRKYCVPGVLAQCDDNFRWLLGFTASYPRPWVSEVLRATGNRAEAVPVPRSRTFNEHVTEDLAELQGESITIRLDSDDAIHYQFVSKVKSIIRSGECVAFSPTAFLWPSSMDVTLREDPRPQTIAYWGMPGETVYSLGSHSKISHQRLVPTRDPLHLTPVHKRRHRFGPRPGIPSWRDKEILTAFGITTSPRISMFSAWRTLGRNLRWIIVRVLHKTHIRRLPSPPEHRI